MARAGAQSPSGSRRHARLRETRIDFSQRLSRGWSLDVHSSCADQHMQGNDRGNAQFIEVIKSIGLHEHLCLIYSNREEQIAAIRPFLEIGLERHEKVLYIADENTATTVRDALRERGIEIAGKGRLHSKPGYLDPDFAIGFLSQQVNEAKATGFSALRVIGEMTWALGEDADSGRLIEFELKVNRFLRHSDVIGICQYDLTKFSPEIILGVLRTHPRAIYRGDVCRNPYYIPPEEFLKPNRAALELDRLLANIHASQQAERIIAANEQRWRSIFENSAIGIAMAELDGRFVVTNRAYQELVGYTAAELQQAKLPDLTHEDDRGNTIDLMGELRADQRTEFQIEKRCLRKNRPSLWVRTTMSLIRDPEGSPRYLMALVEDITERKQAEENLRTQTEVLQKIFDHIPVMINLTGEDGRLKLVSREWERILGWRLKEILKEDVDVIAECYPDLRDRQTVLNFRAGARGEWFELKTRTRGGQTIDTRWAVVKLTDGTTVGIGEDITERKRAEEELQRSFKQLHELTGRLQSVREEERARVAREIHDELGQALTAIKIDLASLIRALRTDQKAESQKAESILKLVDEAIMSVRRIATELRPGILDDLGLVAAVEWAAEEFEARTGTKCGLDLPDEDLVLDSERATGIFRIFQETLTNVTRHAEATQVDVRLVWEDGNIVLEVRDNGRGIVEEQLSSGRSLGILGMRERALLLGGQLTIRGGSGKGTIVKVLIPEAVR
jgi:PAS domain S-box-containing protein